MYLHKNLSLPLFALILLSATACAQPTREEVITSIEKWYDRHPDGYELILNEGNTTMEVQSLYRRPEDPQDQLLISFQGMLITLQFDVDLHTIEWTPENFRKHFGFFTLDDIPVGIRTMGWDVHARVPVSSAGSEKIAFLRVSEDEVEFEINWETYTVGGYSTEKHCQDELEIADNSIPESCMAWVRRRHPLKIYFYYQK